MKHQLYILCLIFLIKVCNPTPLCAKDAPTSAEQLRSDLASALNAKNTNAVMSLFNGEGDASGSKESPGLTETMIRVQISAMLQTNVVSVKLSPLPTGFQPAQANELSGLRQKFNVAVEGTIDVKSQNGQLMQLPYGKKGNVFYIAGSVLEQTHGKSLYVQVSAGPNPDVLTFTGCWAYIKDGREIKVEISDKTNQFKICRGDYIKSCIIQRTSTNSLDAPGFAGWFSFQILEDGRNIFESPQLTNENPFVYEKK
jgi:hypothetical protein